MMPQSEESTPAATARQPRTVTARRCWRNLVFFALCVLAAGVTATHNARKHDWHGMFNWTVFGLLYGAGIVYWYGQLRRVRREGAFQEEQVVPPHFDAEQTRLRVKVLLAIMTPFLCGALIYGASGLGLVSHPILLASLLICAVGYVGAAIWSSRAFAAEKRERAEQMMTGDASPRTPTTAETAAAPASDHWWTDSGTRAAVHSVEPETEIRKQNVGG